MSKTVLKDPTAKYAAAKVRYQRFFTTEDAIASLSLEGSGFRLYQDVFNIPLRVLDENIEVAIIPEHAGVEKFEFGLILSTSAVFLH